MKDEETLLRRKVAIIKRIPEEFRVYVGGALQQFIEEREKYQKWRLIDPKKSEDEANRNRNGRGDQTNRSSAKEEKEGARKRPDIVIRIPVDETEEPNAFEEW